MLNAKLLYQTNKNNNVVISEPRASKYLLLWRIETVPAYYIAFSLENVFYLKFNFFKRSVLKCNDLTYINIEEHASI